MKFRKLLIVLSIIIVFIFTPAAFANSEMGFEYIFGNQGVEIISYNGSDADVAIPVSLGGQQVTGILEHAFEGNTSILTLTMPSTIEIIGDYAFANCANLTMINVSSGLKVIGNSAFSGCSSLGSFTLPPALTSIGRDAFAGCTNIVYYLDLTEGKIEEIGRNAFNDTAWFKSVTDEMVTIGQGHVLLSYRGNDEQVTFPWNIMVIAEDAFAGNYYIKSLVLPDYIKQLNRGAISEMLFLESISGGEGIISVAEAAFRDLPSLSQIDLPNAELTNSNFLDCPQSPYGTEVTSVYNPNIADPSDTYFVSDFDEDLEGIIILHCNNDASFPNGVMEVPERIRGKKVKVIGSGACQDRSDIVQVILPNSVEIIQSWAFAYDSALDNVIFPDSLKIIEADAFNGCPIADHAPELDGVTIDERAFYHPNN